MTILTEKFRFIKDGIFLCPRVDTKKRAVVEDDIFLFIQRTDKLGKVNQSDFYSTRHQKGKIISPEEFKNYLKLRETQNITFGTHYEKLLRIEHNQPKCDIKKLIKIDSEKEKYDKEYEYNILKKWIKEFADLDLRCFSFIHKVIQTITNARLNSKGEFRIFINRPYINIDFFFNFLLKDNPKFILEYLEWAEKLHQNDEINLTEKIFPILEYLGYNRYNKKYKHFEEMIHTISNLKLSNKILLLLFENPHSFSEDLIEFIKKFKPDFVTSCLNMIRDELDFVNSNKNAQVLKNLKIFIRFAQRSRSDSENRKQILNYILDLNLPIDFLKEFPHLIIFFSENNPGYFDNLISKINEKYDVFDFFKQDIESYIEFLFALKKKNKYIGDILSKIPLKTYFLDRYVLDSLLSDNPDLYEILGPRLKTEIFEYTTSPFDWVGVLFMIILDREPTFIQDFLTILDRKLTFKGKRDEKKFIDKIDSLLDYIWYDFTGEDNDGIDQYSYIHTSTINEIMNLNPSMDLFKNNPNNLILISKEYPNTLERYLKEYIIPQYKETKSKSELFLLLKPVLRCLDYVEWRGDYGLSLLVNDQTRKKILKIIFKLNPSIDLFKSDPRFLNFLDYPGAENYLSQYNIKHPYFCDVSEEEAEILNSISTMIGYNLTHSPSKDFSESIFGYFQKDGHVSKLHLDGLDYYLYSEDLIDLFQKLQGLKYLKHLSLNQNHIQSLPENIGEISTLITLELNYTQLEKLPDTIGNLKSLKSLSVENNKLDKLPDTIGNLKSLETLKLRSNNLKILPASFCNLKNLENLQLHRNQLKILPDSIGNLSKLKLLWLSENKLQKLPNSIGNLSFLKNFVIDSNKIDPYSISNIKKKLNIRSFRC